jgi:hypothetical protein
MFFTENPTAFHTTVEGGGRVDFFLLTNLRRTKSEQA